MGLGPRLRALAAAVPSGTSVVDIGAGDGLLAEALAGRGCRVIATELRPGPWRVVAERLRAKPVEVRQGDGLSVVSPGEVSVAVVAGMGGRTIMRILEEARDVVRRLELLVLQPMQHQQELRAAVTAGPYRVLSETSIEQAGRQHIIFMLNPGGDDAAG